MMDYFIAFMIIVVAIFLWDWFEKPKQANEEHCSEEEIALAEFLEKRKVKICSNILLFHCLQFIPIALKTKDSGI